MLLALAVLAGLLAPDRDFYHGAKQIEGVVLNCEAVPGSRLAGGTYAQVHVRLADGIVVLACTPWGGPLEHGLRVHLTRGPCELNPDGNLIVGVDH